MPNLTSQNPSDATLVRQAAQGDKEAFVQIVARYQGLVSAVTLAILKNPAASEDAAQEVFLASWKKLSSLREPSKLRPWLVAIARQHSLAALKKKKPDVSFDDKVHPTESPAPQPDEVSSQRDEQAFVFRALADLPEKYRLPLVLYYREEQSTARVAAALSLSQDAVRQRLSRGRLLLRDRVENSLSDTLRRNAPTQVFTLAVAAGIGLAKPTSATAATLAIKSVTPSPADPSTVVTMMTATKKSSLAVAAGLTLCSLPIGYGIGKVTTHYSSVEPPRLTAPVISPTTSARPELDLTTLDSPTLALWRELHATHGNGPESMPLIWGDIKKMPGGFARDALKEALSAEWAQVDPVSGYKARLGFHYVENWIKADPEGAIAGIKAHTKNPEKALTQHLSQIARSAPHLLIPLLEEIPENIYSSGRIRPAFELIAATDPIALLHAAREMKGYARDEALSAAVCGWAKADPTAALSWAKKQKDHVRLMSDAMRGWSQIDPLAALEGQENDYRLYGNASVVEKAAEVDLVATLAWFGKNPKALKDNPNLLNEVTWQQLSFDPIPYLNLLKKNGLDSLLPRMLSGEWNEQPNISLRWREVAEWARDQKPSPATEALQGRLATDLTRNAPEEAFAFIDTLPEGKARENAIAKAASRLLELGDLISTAEELTQAHPDWAPQIYRAALDKLRPESFSQPEKWIEAIEFLSLPDKRNSDNWSTLRQFANAWLPNDPDAAAEWFFENDREDSNIFYTGLLSWSYRDNPAFQDWANNLPSGQTREYITPYLIREDFENSREDVHTWNLLESISEPRFLKATAQQLSERIDTPSQQKDLIAKIQQSPLSSEKKENLTRFLKERF